MKYHEYQEEIRGCWCTISSPSDVSLSAAGSCARSGGRGRAGLVISNLAPLRSASAGSSAALLPGAAFSHNPSLSAEFQLPNWFGDGTDLFFFFFPPLGRCVMRAFRETLNY